MYVWRDANLPADPVFADSFEGLGFHINDNDQIRQIAKPDESWKFKINRNERWNIRHREALNDCIRTIIMQRLDNLGMEIMRLPLGRKSSEPNVPILLSKNIVHDRKFPDRILVVFGEATQDLGVWAYRAIHDGINYGSVVDLSKHVLVEKREENVGLILANTGQLIWHCGSRRTVTQQTWQALPRPYAAWGQPTMSSRNKIDGHNDWYEHVKYVFDKVLWPLINGKNTRLDVIGMSDGGLAAIRHLQRGWSVWKPYINAIALGDPQQTTYSDLNMSTLADPESFTSFVASRCRGYVLSEKPVGSPEFRRYRDHGCNCYSSGEALNTECIMAAAWGDMLAWLDVLWKDPKFHETLMLRAEDLEDDVREELEAKVQSEAEAEAEAAVSGLEEDLASVSLDGTIKPSEDVKAGPPQLKGHPLRTVTCVDEEDEPQYAKA